jgi:hypothetical protein
MFAAPQVPDDARIDVTAAGAHHQALLRGQPHRGVDGPAFRDRRGRRAVTQMQHNLIQLRQRPAQEGGGLFADILVRRAVKSVPADAPFLGQLVVDCVSRSGRRQVVKERCVEHRDMRDIWQYLTGHFDST